MTELLTNSSYQILKGANDYDKQVMEELDELRLEI